MPLIRAYPSAAYPKDEHGKEQKNGQRKKAKEIGVIDGIFWGEIRSIAVLGLCIFSCLIDPVRTSVELIGVANPIQSHFGDIIQSNEIIISRNSVDG